MRLLPVSLLCTLFASVVIAESSEERLGSTETPGEEETVDLADPTTFNGVQVPPLPDIDGEKFNATIKDGYWFIKHHS